jgi:hypothetical protein
MSLQLRIEFFNVFNRANMADPISTNALATQTRSNGVPTAGFGYINSQSLGNGSTLNNNTGLGGNPRPRSTAVALAVLVKGQDAVCITSCPG